MNKAYKDKMPTANRCLKVIKEVAGDCWWIEQYLRGVYLTRTRNNTIDTYTINSKRKWSNRK